MIVAISGIDGSGKSSLASNLVKKLAARDCKVKRVYLGEYILAGYLVKVIHKVYRLFMPAASNHTAENPFLSTKPKSIFQRSWLFFSIFDNVLFYLILKTYVLFGYNVICDRYFFDKLVGFIHHGYCGPLLEKFYLFLTPTADTQIILDQNPKTCMERETGGNHSIEFYEQLRKHYWNLRGLIKCHYIEVNGKGEEDVASEVFLKICAPTTF